MNDHGIRIAAFEWLSRQVEIRGDVLPWALLTFGFEIQGQRIPLVSQQGIFKPRHLALPISIRPALGATRFQGSWMDTMRF
jgi:putative restriction endonuclease